LTRRKVRSRTFGPRSSCLPNALSGTGAVRDDAMAETVALAGKATTVWQHAAKMPAFSQAR
jgi:hypothetical protein